MYILYLFTFTDNLNLYGYEVPSHRNVPLIFSYRRNIGWRSNLMPEGSRYIPPSPVPFLRVKRQPSFVQLLNGIRLTLKIDLQPFLCRFYTTDLPAYAQVKYIQPCGLAVLEPLPAKGLGVYLCLRFQAGEVLFTEFPESRHILLPPGTAELFLHFRFSPQQAGQRSVYGEERLPYRRLRLSCSLQSGGTCPQVGPIGREIQSRAEKRKQNILIQQRLRGIHSAPAWGWIIRREHQLIRQKKILPPAP